MFCGGCAFGIRHMGLKRKNRNDVVKIKIDHKNKIS
jgi:hypothetical protein